MMRHIPPRRRAATVYIRTLIAIMGIGAMGCYEVVQPTDDRTLILQLSDTATADGSSMTEIRAAVRGELSSEDREVQLVTTAGTFTANGVSSVTLPLDQLSTATALLRAPTEPGLAIVTMKVAGGTTSARITFAPATAEYLEVVPATPVITGGSGGIDVTVWLRRKTGQVSPGTEVSFSAVANTGASWADGRFIPRVARSDAEGKAVTRFVTTDTSARGAVFIRAVAQPGGSTGEARIDVVAP